jgi:hypothetical protein
MNADKVSVVMVEKVISSWVVLRLGGDCLLQEKNDQGRSRNGGGRSNIKW